MEIGGFPGVGKIWDDKYGKVWYNSIIQKRDNQGSTDINVIQLRKLCHSEVAQQPWESVSKRVLRIAASLRSSQ